MEDNKPSLLPAESCELIKILRGRERDPPDDDVTWVSAQDLTVEVGKEQLAEYIRSWRLEPRWIYSLDFLCWTEEEHRIFYHYRARFSTPSPEKPIQGSASVYFALDVLKDASPSQPVEVHFVVESNRFIHTPGRTHFTEKWLLDIIESKSLLRAAFNV